MWIIVPAYYITLCVIGVVRHPSVLHHNGIRLQSHRQWRLCSMECIPQRCRQECVVDQLIFDLLLSAAVTDHLLLFSHRLLATCQGNK